MKIRQPAPMAEKSLLKTVRQYFSPEGYTLLESLLVLLVFAMLTVMLASQLNYQDNKSVNHLINEIVLLQFEAIIENEERYYDLYNMDIVFNRIGNVNHADSYQYQGNEIIVSLGTGRIYNYDNEER
ncbi:MAG: hypothetical protein ACI4WG_06335 [Erysipelotrichaceae bacterium]